MTLAQEITRKLGGDWRGNEGLAPGPGHSKADRSLAIKDADGGDDVILHSFANDDVLAIKAAWRRQGLLPERSAKPAGERRVVASFTYTDQHGAPLYIIERIEPGSVGRAKDFIARQPNGRPGMGGAKPVPYRLPDLAGAADLADWDQQPVFIVEGERKADALAAWGLTATCNPFGAGKWPADFAQWLEGRRVVILPDCDEPGRVHADDVARKLHGTAASIYMLNLPGLPAKGDLLDWIAAGGTRDQFEVLAANAPTWEPGAADAIDTAGTVAGLVTINVGDWAGLSAPPRPWIVDGWLPSKAVTLLAGEGGTGKSLAVQQWLSCLSLGVPLIGIRGVQPVRCFYLNCEDPAEELQRRQEAIAKAIDRDMAAFGRDMTIAPRLGELDNSLGTFDADGRFVAGPLLNAVRDHCLANAVRVAAFDNVAHLFTGNENDRGQVTAFLNALSRLALEIDGAVILVGHPAKADGSEYSGSTAWENGVRNRLYMSRPDGSDGNALENRRILSRNKSNMAAIGDTITMTWHAGAFYAEADIDVDALADGLDAKHDAAFLRCLDKATEQRRNVSHMPSAAYAPKVFAGMKDAAGIGQKALEKAMHRLFDAGLIVANVELWRDEKSRPKHGIKRAENVPNPRPEPVPNTGPKPPEPIPQTAPPTPPYTTYNAGGAWTPPAPQMMLDASAEAAWWHGGAEVVDGVPFIACAKLPAFARSKGKTADHFEQHFDTLAELARCAAGWRVTDTDMAAELLSRRNRTENA